MDKLDFVKDKIIAKEDLTSRLSYWKFKNQKVAFTNGCFDIIHRGHIEYLARAASMGNILIVGLNTDSSVKRLKGEGRPFQDEMSRALTMASLQFVTVVVFFDEDTPYELIKLIKPDILVKGSDYKKEEIVGYDIVNKSGGEIVTIDFVEGYSTTKIINKLFE